MDGTSRKDRGKRSKCRTERFSWLGKGKLGRLKCYSLISLASSIVRWSFSSTYMGLCFLSPSCSIGDRVHAMSSPSSDQRRQFGLAAAIAIVVGESIALGIFLTPATMAKSLGSPLLLGLVWMGMALMAMCGALCYAELAIRYPESGGEYVYLRAGYGDRIAFLYGWMSSIVMYPGVAAALAVGASAYVAQLLPLNATALAFVPASILCVFGFINMVGTRLSG